MRTLSFAIAAAVGLGFGSISYGAAALAAGAITSAKPTATNPVQRQMQIAADPMGITDFQFSLYFDPNLLFVATDPTTGLPLIRAINGYVLGNRFNVDLPAYAIDYNLGIVSVRGYWPASNGQVPMEEIDVYDVVFQLVSEDDAGDPIDIRTVFEVRAGGSDGRISPFGPNFPDFMWGGFMDLDTGRPVTQRVYTAGDPNNPILDSTTGPVAIVPEPAAVLVLAVPAGLLMRRRSA